MPDHIALAAPGSKHLHGGVEVHAHALQHVTYICVTELGTISRQTTAERGDRPRLYAELLEQGHELVGHQRISNCQAGVAQLAKDTGGDGGQMSLLLPHGVRDNGGVSEVGEERDFNLRVTLPSTPELLL